MAILITGGTGYIGSHTVVELLNLNKEVVVLDNFVNSSPDVIDKIKKITGKSFKFYEVDLLDKQNLKRETMVLLAILNLNYWCDSEEEKQEILNGFAENEKLKQLEEKELAEKYNPDNLFKKREKLEATTEVSMSEYKELNFIQKLLNKIKSFFRR